MEDNWNNYSEETQEVLSHPPKTIVLWGNTILLAFILLIVILSWYIKYPDIVRANIIITTQIPPEKIIVKATGKIEHIFVTDRSFITKNTPIAIIESTGSYQDIYALKQLIELLDITKNDIEFPIEETSSLLLGAVESSYASFEKSYLAYNVNQTLQPYLIDKQAQSFEQTQQESRLKLLLDQKDIASKELEYKKIELERHKKLFEKKVIPAQEWETKNLEYLQQQKNMKDLDSQITMIRSSLIDLAKNKKTTLLGESKDQLTLKRDLILSLNQLKKSIIDWELTHVIQNSIDGRITFLKIWEENQNVNVGDNVFVVIPENNNFIGKVKAIALNSGKIREGQQVNIRLENYPDREFGIVKGKVKSASLIPDHENNLLVDIDLPNGLNTSYNKELSFQQEMSGTVDIITEDLRLIERILYRFRDLFKR